MKEFSKEEKALFETDMQDVLKKHSAILICQPFISPKGTVEAVLNVYKQELHVPSPYVVKPEGGQGGVPVEVPVAPKS